MIPRPEPRGHPGNLGVLFEDRAHDERTALVDLYDADRPQALSYRALDGLCNGVARGLVRAGLAAGQFEAR